MSSIALDTDSQVNDPLTNREVNPSVEEDQSSLSDSITNIELKDVGSPFVSMPAIPMSEYLADPESRNLEKVFRLF